MDDETCPHEKMRFVVDTSDGKEKREVCPLCDDVDVTTLDNAGDSE